MADLAQLERALVNADAAGDTEAARTLAQAIRSQRTQAPQAAQAPQIGGMQRFAAGLIDPIQGGAQMLENSVRAVSPAAVDAINNLNNKLAEWGLVGKLPAGGVQQQTREREAALRTDGIDWPRMAGNVLSPVNAALGAGLPAAATTAGRVAGGAGLGAIAGGLMPSTGSAEDKLTQMGVGAAGGTAVPAVTAGIGRLISPAASTNPQLAALKAEGIRPTVGQALGGFANKAEEKAISLPLLGDSIAAARTRAAGDLNQAVANRALAPIGQAAPKGLDGRELVGHVQRQLGDAYDTLLPKLTVQADRAFAQEVQSLRGMVQTGSIDPNAAKTFQRILQNDVLGKFKGQGALTGQTMKQVESDLGQKISQLGGSTDADARLVADALREVQSSLRSLVQRNNPQYAQELKAINTGYANFKRLERAASSLGAEDGTFSAAQLQNAVKALDRSKDKGKFARGEAFMQDLADPAKSLLGSKVPNSGTADRLMNAGALASGLVNPAIPLGLLGGAGMYSAPVQRALLGLVSSRPSAAQPIASLLNRTSPMLSPAGGLLSLQALE
jgi:hypothetical protein